MGGGAAECLFAVDARGESLLLVLLSYPGVSGQGSKFSSPWVVQRGFLDWMPAVAVPCPLPVLPVLLVIPQQKRGVSGTVRNESLSPVVDLVLPDVDMVGE